VSGVLERSGQPRGDNGARMVAQNRTNLEMVGAGGGKPDSGRALPKGKPMAYAASVPAGRVGGGAVWLWPNISEGGNPGPTPLAYHLVGRGE